MIKVLAKVTIKEEMIGVSQDSIQGFIDLTRKEEGCISCHVLQDVNNKNVFIMAEEWESPEAHQNHLNSGHFQLEMTNLAKVQEKEMEVNVCIQVV